MGKMKDETYKAFLVAVDYGSHNRIWEGSRYFKREDKVNGQCKLEVVMEADNVNEIFNYVPVKE